MLHRRAAIKPLTVVVILALSGCSSDKFGTRTQTWDEAGDTSDYQAPTKQAETGKKLTAREYAANFSTSAECELEARRIAPTNETGSVALFRACLEREDFRELEPFYSPPWNALLGDTKAMLQLGRVIANRGGWVVEDVAAVQREDVPVVLLSQAIEQPAVARGKVVIARLRYLKPNKDAPGQQVFEEVTLTPDEDMLEAEEAAGPATSRFPTTLTGQRVVLELPDELAPLRAGDELVVVAEFLGSERITSEDGTEEQEIAVLNVLGRYLPSTRIRG